MNIFLTLLAVVCLMLAPRDAPAEAMTYYHYLTDIETTIYGEIIWFWTPDTVYGPMRSNDFIGLRYSPTFFGQLICSKPVFRYYNPGNIYFEYPPIMGAPPYRFPKTLMNVRRMASVIDGIHQNRNGERFELMTWIRMRGDAGIDVHQYPLGSEPSESLVARYAPPDWGAIWVNGQVELEGTLTGRLTVGASDDIWLVDDCRYTGANRYNGRFEEGAMRNMLGVVSEKNIIIRNNLRNGRANGIDVEPNNWNRHSIVLNGSYIALNESFTFQHHNDDWDAYQGPTPDERGYIYLKGGIAQQRRGYTHRANHTGTGYWKSYKYDYRLLRTGPPGFAPGEYDDVHGEYDDLLFFDGRYDVEATRVGVLTVEAGVEVVLHGGGALSVTDSLIVRGTAERPVIFRASGGGGVRVYRGRAYASLSHARFEEHVEFGFDGARMVADNCLFSEATLLTGAISIDSSKFVRSLTLSGSGDKTVERSLFTGGLTVGGTGRNNRVVNCTAVGSRSAGVRVEAREGVEITNCVVAGNRWGIYRERNYEVATTYSCVWDNYGGDFEECFPGVGTISRDPRFTDARRDDFTLGWGSPCIDAGDPNSPRDPDGSRADMGAFAFDHVRGVEEDSGLRIVEFGVSAAPNPFNADVTLNFSLKESSSVRLRILDLQGRELAVLADGFWQGGGHRVEWRADRVAAGVYLVALEGDKGTALAKLVKID